MYKRQPLYLLYRSVFSKISVVLTTKLSDNYVWDKEEDITIKAGLLSGIIKELKTVSYTHLDVYKRQVCNKKSLVLVCNLGPLVQNGI